MSICDDPTKTCEDCLQGKIEGCIFPCKISQLKFKLEDHPTNCKLDFKTTLVEKFRLKVIKRNAEGNVVVTDINSITDSAMFDTDPTYAIGIRLPAISGLTPEDELFYELYVDLGDGLGERLYSMDKLCIVYPESMKNRSFEIDITAEVVDPRTLVITPGEILFDGGNAVKQVVINFNDPNQTDGSDTVTVTLGNIATQPISYTYVEDGDYVAEIKVTIAEDNEGCLLKGLVKYFRVPACIRTDPFGQVCESSAACIEWRGQDALPLNEMDNENVWPLRYVVNGQQINIDRDASWDGLTLKSVFYQPVIDYVNGLGNGFSMEVINDTIANMSIRVGFKINLPGVGCGNQSLSISRITPGASDRLEIEANGTEITRLSLVEIDTGEPVSEIATGQLFACNGFELDGIGESVLYTALE